MKILEDLLFRFYNNPYLMAVRNGLTMAIPIIMAATLAILINNIPSETYTNFMSSIFGENWRAYCQYVYNGSFGIFSLLMVLSISYSLGENYYDKATKNYFHPGTLALTALSCLVIITEPWTVLAEGVSESMFIAKWFSVYGLFVAICVSLVSSFLFKTFLGIGRFNVRFHSGVTSTTMVNTLNTLIPALLVMGLFALAKVLFLSAGITDIHQATYTFICLPFENMGVKNASTAILYNTIRHVLWFFGIHGANVLEPVMLELYAQGLEINAAAGIFPLYLEDGPNSLSIFSKPFFDSYSTIGGAGATLGLLISCFLFHKDRGILGIARISAIPSLFNINELILFGFPVVLNPTFLIPFILVPIVCTITSELAILLNLVPLPTHDVAWNIPVFINAYIASGSVAGCVLQLFNIAISVAIYTPFVMLDSRIQHKLFTANFKNFTSIACGSTTDEDDRARLLSLPHPLGAIAHDLVDDMKRAIANNELFCLYQPQVDSNTGRVYGVESLIRWKHPHIGMIPPPVLIGLAEDTGYIEELGLWSFEQSIKQVAQWRKRGINSIGMSINLSSKQLGDALLTQKMLSILDAYEVPVSNVKLELTETAALSPTMLQNNVLKSLSEANFPIAIDDFGMGHSSITYLKKFNVSAIKLDAVLTRDVLGSRNSCQIIRSIIELAEGLNIAVIAEFVEDEAHLLRLRSLGCNNIQGYFYSPPLDAEACLAFISSPHRAYGPLRREEADSEFYL